MAQKELSPSKTTSSIQSSSSMYHDDAPVYESDTHTYMETENGRVTPSSEDDPALSLAPNSAYDLPSGVNSSIIPGSMMSNRQRGCASSHSLSDSEQRDQKMQKRTDKLEDTLFNRACAFIGWS